MWSSVFLLYLARQNVPWYVQPEQSTDVKYQDSPTRGLCARGSRWYWMERFFSGPAVAACAFGNPLTTGTTNLALPGFSSVCPQTLPSFTESTASVLCLSRTEDAGFCSYLSFSHVFNQRLFFFFFFLHEEVFNVAAAFAAKWLICCRAIWMLWEESWRKHGVRGTCWISELTSSFSCSAEKVVKAQHAANSANLSLRQSWWKWMKGSYFRPW